jgi:hypothetical protein
MRISLLYTMTAQLLFSIAVQAGDVPPPSNVQVPVDKTVDTGSHTCTSIGQEKKVYDDAIAGEGRYFVDESLTTVSQFGAGNCTYESDGAGPSVEMKKFKFVDADGAVEMMDKPVRYRIRAFADCTNNPAKLTTQIGTECKFTGVSKRGIQ